MSKKKKKNKQQYVDGWDKQLRREKRREIKRKRRLRELERESILNEWISEEYEQC